jgi:hypothetical protein
VTDLTEPLEEPRSDTPVPAPQEPVEADDLHAELGRKNARLGWSLFGLSLLLFAGVWAVAYIYLALD